MQKMDLGDSSDVWLDMPNAGEMEILVDNPFGDLAFDPMLPLMNQPQFFYASPPSSSSPSSSDHSTNDTSTGDGDGDGDGASVEDAQGKAKRHALKRDRRQLEVPAEGMAATLPKEVELELDSLDDFDDYVAKLKKTRSLNAAENAAIQKQRKQIRNRLYAKQKRAKEKQGKREEMSLLQQLQMENTQLKEENARLRQENAALRVAASTFSSNSGSGRGGSFALFAVFACALVLTPSSVFSSATDYGASTGRSLLGLSDASSGWGLVIVRALLLVAVALIALGRFRPRLFWWNTTNAAKKNV